MWNLGPRDRNVELTESEQLEVLEAEQSADEYLNMEENSTDDFYFETEE